MLKKLLLFYLMSFSILQITFINCMEESREDEIDLNHNYLEELPPELLNLLIFEMLPIKAENSVHLALMFLAITKDLRLSNKYFKKNVEELIKSACSMTDSDFLLLQEAFSKKIIYHNLETRKLSYDFSDTEQDTCKKIVELLYSKYIENIETEKAFELLTNLISQCVTDNQKKALQYLGSTAIYKILSESTEIGSLSINIIHETLTISNLKSNIKQLFNKGIYGLREGKKLGPLQWAIIFDRKDIIEIFLNNLTFVNWLPVFEILKFATLFANQDSFALILDSFKNYFEPHFLEYWDGESIFQCKTYWAKNGNALQLAFDIGDEEKFKALIEAGVPTEILDSRETKANKNSKCFSSLMKEKKKN